MAEVKTGRVHMLGGRCDCDPIWQVTQPHTTYTMIMHIGNNHLTVLSNRLQTTVRVKRFNTGQFTSPKL